MRMTLLLAASAAALLAACTTVAASGGPAPAIGEFGVDLTNRDQAVKPGDDFFRYANGTWLKTFKMPADKSRFGAFDELGEKSEHDVKAIIDGFATSNPTPNPLSNDTVRDRPAVDEFQSLVAPGISGYVHQPAGARPRFEPDSSAFRLI